MSVPITTRALPKSAVARVRKGLQNKRGLAWALVLPALIVLIAVGIVPTLYTLALAFTTSRPGATLFELEFAGIANFLRAFRADRFWHGLMVSGCFLFLSVGVQLCIGMVLALALQRVVPLFQRAAVTVILVPMMIVPAVVGLMWRLMFNETYGPINFLLGIAGLPQPAWISDPLAALAALMIADIWEWTPFVVILLLAGLQSLSQEVHEAAYVDGANAWSAFRFITLPLMRPFIFLAVFLRMIDAWKAFDLVATLTQGGPGNLTESIGFYTWKVGFGVSGDRHLAAAISLFQLVVIIILGQILLKQLNRISRER